MFSNESLVMLGNESMENQSEAFGEEMICPEISDDQSILLTDFAYWMEGVILLSIGCPGILGMLDTIQDFLSIKPRMHLGEISILSLNSVIVRPTKIMNRADENWAHF